MVAKRLAQGLIAPGLFVHAQRPGVGFADIREEHGFGARHWHYFPAISFKNSSAFSLVKSRCSVLPVNMHGAYSQAPRHSANSIVRLPSLVVSPGLTPAL